MNFGSKYAYEYDNDSEEECLSDTEYSEGIIASSKTKEDEKPKRKSKGSLFGNLISGRRKSASKPLSDSSSEGKSSSPPKGGLSTQHCTTVQRSQPTLPLQQRTSARGGRKWRRADTNVITVRFDKLISPSDMHTGDAVHCEECTAVLSNISKVTGQDHQVWCCEFCNHCNEVDLMEEEIPRTDDVTFMLKPAVLTTENGKCGTDQSLVVFCVDTSGSMCVTTEVKGSINLRGDRTSQLQSLNTTGEPQYIRGQRRDLTYVSRLQGVQAAVDHQLATMQKEHPNRRVALVAFNSEVKVIGDGSSTPAHFSGDKLGNVAEMIKAGTDLPLPKSISDTRSTLGDKVFDLEEGGQTALGPALLLSVSLACQVPGSKVIICTDGMANVGLGTLDLLPDDPKYQESTDFYEEISKMAMDKGISISVISIKGTNCKMAELGKMADITGGQVNIVDPLKLTQEFGSILADPIIATNVTATLQVHNGLYIRNEPAEVSKAVRDVGNVTKSSEITFEYGVRKKKLKTQEKDSKDKKLLSGIMENKEEDKEAEASAFNNPTYEGEAQPSTSATTAGATASGSTQTEEKKELPFQLQITYTDLDGAQAMRLITRNMPVTRDRHVAEREMNPEALTVHAAQQTARYALDGAYTSSRMNAFMYDRLFKRNLDSSALNAADVEECYDNYLDRVGNMEKMVRSRHEIERSRLAGTTYSDEEEDDCDLDVAYSVNEKNILTTGISKVLSSSAELPVKAGPVRKTRMKKAQKSRTAECDDLTANCLYENAHFNYDNLKKK